MDSSSTSAGPRVLAGRYRLGERLGRGGMGDVYRATDQVLARQVAVKVFRPDTGDEALEQRHESEARVLAGLNHPGLVSVYDIGTDDEQPFLVMELVEGETLADLIRRGPLEPSLVASLGGQLAASLQVIHDAGVIHRDIKPANVLVCSGDDGALRTKLTDFGIARLVDGTRLTSTGLLLGTAQYLSPEQTIGGAVSHPCDIYALGLVLLECLTGRPAFPGVGIETAVVRLNRPPEVPAELGPHWAGVLGAMTAREPEDRPTAGDVAAALSAVVAGAPVAPVAALLPAAAAAGDAGAAAGNEPGRPTADDVPTEVGEVPARPAPGRRRRTAWGVSVGAAAALATAVTVAATWSGTPATGEPATGATSPVPSSSASSSPARSARPATAPASPTHAGGAAPASPHPGKTTTTVEPSATPTPTGQGSPTTSAPAPSSPAPTTGDGAGQSAEATSTAPSDTPDPSGTGSGRPTDGTPKPDPKGHDPKGHDPKGHHPKPSPDGDQPPSGGPSGGTPTPTGDSTGSSGTPTDPAAVARP